jgi:polysaccharide pyruvyl transferase WcaK-like protein
VLDVSGGDSFSDIYGSKRFMAVTRPKLIAAYRRVPLILLPQTYGPFRSERARRIARDAVLAARMAWARDPRSFRALQELVGEGFDPSRHHEGVDMAFSLEAVAPGSKLTDRMRDWLEDSRNQPTVGLNVSGLIALDQHSHRRFGLRADYTDALVRFAREIMNRHEIRLLLIPHVMTSPGTPESDAEACLRIADELGADFRSRVATTPTDLTECEVKWVISKLDWFCGTRMHSTIAGLSSGVPTAAVAYSDKTLGVFESCGVADQVIDPRKLNTEQVVERLIDSFDSRAEKRRLLSTSIPNVKSRAEKQFRCIVDALKELPQSS